MAMPRAAEPPAGGSEPTRAVPRALRAGVRLRVDLSAPPGGALPRAPRRHPRRLCPHLPKARRLPTVAARPSPGCSAFAVGCAADWRRLARHRVEALGMKVEGEAATPSADAVLQRKQDVALVLRASFWSTSASSGAPSLHPSRARRLLHAGDHLGARRSALHWVLAAAGGPRRVHRRTPPTSARGRQPMTHPDIPPLADDVRAWVERASTLEVAPAAAKAKVLARVEAIVGAAGPGGAGSAEGRDGRGSFEDGGDTPARTTVRSSGASSAAPASAKPILG